MAMIEANTCLGSQKLFITNRNTSIYFNEFIHKILKKFCKVLILKRVDLPFNSTGRKDL